MYGMERKQIIAAFILLGVILFGTGYKAAQLRLEAEVKTVIPAQVEPKTKPKTDSVGKITVYVSGAVKNPGVYTFDEGARIIDGLNKAQPSSDAAMEYINLAEPMSDGQQIAVPRKSEVANIEMQNGANGVYKGNNKGSGKININTASQADLETLPGVGPSTAEKIIQYRKANGRFRNVSDLLNISGIGDKTLAKFKDKVTI